ncbi:MAG: protein-L-isoaspartate(D-aspartate) O-methyltransferase [Candidatus Aenigmatarchaeota archaeon]
MRDPDSRERLIELLIAEGWLKTPAIISAFRSVNRELFVPKDMRALAWSDQPLPIGHSQTISAPHMVAIMTELLQPKKSDIVLEIGAGSGYQAAILSKLVKRVITIELEPSLVTLAKKNLSSAGCKNVKIIQGDGSKGWPKEAPYDKIIVTCGCPEIPSTLVEQLKEGGRIVIPVGSTDYQVLTVGIKKKGKLEVSQHGGCIFVPLRH